MLGGRNVVITGPCYKTSKLLCTFGFENPTNGLVINEVRGVCTVPMMKTTGKYILAVSIDAGGVPTTFGKFRSCETFLFLTVILLDRRFKSNTTCDTF